MSFAKGTEGSQHTSSLGYLLQQPCQAGFVQLLRLEAAASSPARNPNGKRYRQGNRPKEPSKAVKGCHFDFSKVVIWFATPKTKQTQVSRKLASRRAFLSTVKKLDIPATLPVKTMRMLQATMTQLMMTPHLTRGDLEVRLSVAPTIIYLLLTFVTINHMKKIKSME